jgi:1,2-diacylglycerol 3-alpha-glucosyltransferase
MIIGQFTDSFPPIADGVARVVQNYALWQHKDGDTCYVITPGVPGYSYEYPFPVLTYHSFSIPFKKNYRTGIPQFDRQFYNELKKVKFDIIHSHSPFPAGELGRKIAYDQGIPFVATLHSKFKDDFKQYLKSDIITDLLIKRVLYFFNQADDVWTVSESAVEILREYGYKKSVFVVNNACDIVPKPKTKEILDEINKRFGFPEDVPVFVYVGQHIWQKNIKLILDGLKLVHEKNYDFRMLFVGDGDKRQEAEQITEEYQLTDKVTFAGIIQDRDLIGNIYARGTALLFPSLYDMSSLVVKEAAAMGCPAVLVKGSTTSLGVKNMQNGFLVENTPESMCEVIIKIIENPELARTVGENATKTLYRSWEDSANIAKERYRYLINRFSRTYSYGS